MKKIVGYVLGALVIYLGFLVALMPAAAVLPWVTLPKQIQLGTVSGSIWQGKVSSINYQGLTVSPVRWQLSPLSLLTASAQVDLNIGTRRSAIKGEGQLTLGQDKLIIEELTLQAPIEQLTLVAPLPMGLNATGSAKLDITHYDYAKPWCSALKGKLNVNELVVASGFGQVEVERAQAKLNCEQGDMVAKLVPSTNSLGIKLDARLDTAKRLTTSGFVKPPTNAPKDFVNLLKFMGQPNPNGQYIINYTMSL